MWGWYACTQEEKLPAWAKGNVICRPGRDESMLSISAHHFDDAHPCYCLTYCGSPFGRLRNPLLLQGDTEIARHIICPNLKTWCVDGFLHTEHHINYNKDDNSYVVLHVRQMFHMHWFVTYSIPPRTDSRKVNFHRYSWWNWVWNQSVTILNFHCSVPTLRACEQERLGWNAVYYLIPILSVC